MKEPNNNVGAICESHAVMRRHTWQAAHKDITIRSGDFVKAAFPSGATAEHMWVRVTKVKGNTICGTLDNDPTLPMDIQHGDSVTIKRSEVEDWISRQ